MWKIELENNKCHYLGLENECHHVENYDESCIYDNCPLNTEEV